MSLPKHDIGRDAFLPFLPKTMPLGAIQCLQQVGNDWPILGNYEHDKVQVARAVIVLCSRIQEESCQRQKWCAIEFLPWDKSLKQDRVKCNAEEFQWCRRAPRFSPQREGCWPWKRRAGVVKPEAGEDTMGKSSKRWTRYGSLWVSSRIQHQTLNRMSNNLEQTEARRTRGKSCLKSPWWGILLTLT